MRLSLCIAVYNEEDNLHYPLDSCIDWVDEVIIVDGQSTDKTVEIAKKYGKKVKIISTENRKMFHINKQMAISAAKGEWILQLDADEEIPKELREEILSIVGRRWTVDKKQSIFDNHQPSTDHRLQSNIVAYYLPRKNWFLNRFLMKGGVYPDYTIRLYKNGVAKFPCLDVHENVKINGKIGYLKNPINHYSDPTFERYINRWKRYANLEAIRLKEQGEKKDIIRLINYLIIKPISTFFLMYFRHLGFMDGLPGLIFAFFSALRFPKIFLLYLFPNNQ
jgi:glycosyltransferase involved in cell wall biosynthesis